MFSFQAGASGPRVLRHAGPASGNESENATVPDTVLLDPNTRERIASSENADPRVININFLPKSVLFKKAQSVQIFEFSQRLI